MVGVNGMVKISYSIPFLGSVQLHVGRVSALDQCNVWVQAMEIQMTAHRMKNQHMRKFVTWAHVPLESLGHGSSQSGLNM